jgi:endonuclease/exonuclease/phosphatase family metal-dependent hydrolase
VTRRIPLALTLVLALFALGAGPIQAPLELRVVSYNIKHGRGMDEVVDLERTAAVIRPLRPDIVGLQEVDDRAKRSGSVAEAERLGQLLGLQHAFGKFMDFQGGAYGLAVLSRHPIVRSTPVQLPEGNEPRVALMVEIRLPDGSTMAAINLHFDWVRDDGFRYAQAETLAKHLDTLKMPYVLLGDFNDVPGSRTLALFRARATEAAKPAGGNLTFSSTKPEREIDYIFYAPADAFRAREVRVIDEAVASDHRPVLAVLEKR